MNPLAAENTTTERDGQWLNAKTLIWQNLGPKGSYLSSEQDNTVFKILQEGIRTWDAFLQYLKHTLENKPREVTTLEFCLDVWAMDALTPPPAFQDSLATLLVHPSDTEQLSVHLLLANATHIVPTLWAWSGTDLSFHNVSTAVPSKYWQNNSKDNLISQFNESRPLYAHLLSCIASLQRTTHAHEHQNESQESKSKNSCWLQQLQRISIAFDPEQNHSTTSLWQMLKDMNIDFLKAALHSEQSSAHQHRKTTSLLALAHNPFSALIRSKETIITLGGVYSIGAGQMVSILDYTRQLIEDGFLPASTPLLADNRAFSAVVELQHTGQRKALLNHLWVNPKDRKPIAVHHEKLRLELMYRYQPKVIFLNVKAQALTHIVNDKLCHALAALPYTPVLVMPSKSYTNAGTTPYEALYSKLMSFCPKLALNLTVLGGFYAAPSILTGDLVHLTIASESMTATHIVSQHLFPLTPPKPGTTAQHESLTLELIASKKEAAMLMSGGANKNFLTYFAARRILRHAFTFDHTKPQQWLEDINNTIRHYRQFNIRTSYDIALKLVQDKALSDQCNIIKDDEYAHQTPAGLATDFIHCLPLTGLGISSLVEQSYRLQKHLLRTPIEQRANVAQQELKNRVDHIRKDPQRVYGTRNARDGLIDELLHYFYYAWQEHKQRIPLTLDAASFYHEFYPSQWKGSSAQEGRNGILPVIVKASILADLKHTQWPSALLESWQDYFPQTAVNTNVAIKQSDDQFEHWHTQLIHLLNWAIQQGNIHWQLAAQRLKEWCQTTRALSLQEIPRMLYQLEQGIVQLEQGQFSLTALCHRIRRDCQYRERQ